MGDMSKIVTAVIGITVSVIVIGTVLAPQIAELTASGAALADYSALLSAVLVMCVLGCLMVGVRLIARD